MSMSRVVAASLRTRSALSVAVSRSSAPQRFMTSEPPPLHVVTVNGERDGSILAPKYVLNEAAAGDSKIAMYRAAAMGVVAVFGVIAILPIFQGNWAGNKGYKEGEKH